MNPIWLVSILETLLLVLLIAAVLFIGWRKKRQHHTELEQLLDDVKERQNQRLNKLTRRFVNKYHLDEASAEALTGQLITAEKLFLQQFISQQMQQTTVSGFYESLCQLLDDYLEAKPAAMHNQPTQQELAPTPEKQQEQPSTAVDGQGDSSNPDPTGGEMADTPPPPDWGDVFD